MFGNIKTKKMEEIQRITQKLIRICNLMETVDLSNYSILCYPSASLKKESARKIARLTKFKEYYLDRLMLATDWEKGETSLIKRNNNLILNQ